MTFLKSNATESELVDMLIVSPWGRLDDAFIVTTKNRQFALTRLEVTDHKTLRKYLAVQIESDGKSLTVEGYSADRLNLRMNRFFEDEEAERLTLAAAHRQNVLNAWMS